MTKTISEPIKVGSKVSFDSDHGPLTGLVIDFIPCLVNGREHARVEIDHTLPGIVHYVPADTLNPTNKEHPLLTKNYFSLPNSAIGALLLHLCGGNINLALNLARWIALPLRAPGTKMNTALIVSGEPGTGKSLFFDAVVRHLYHSTAQTVIREAQFLGHYTGWAMGLRFALIEEFYPASPFLAAEKVYLIKNLVTASTINIERKSLPTKVETNSINYVFMTSKNVDPFSCTDNRRFAILKAPARQPASFYKEVVANISAQAIEEFKAWLMHDLDMGDFNQSSTI